MSEKIADTTKNTAENTHQDVEEVKTGEPSKNQKKKEEKLARLKKEKEEKEAAKKEKAAQVTEKQKEKKGLFKEEEIKDPTAYYENRCHMITNLRSNEKYRPYPHKFNVTHSISEFVKEFNDVCTEKGQFLDKEVSIAGNTFYFFIFLFFSLKKVSSYLNIILKSYLFIYFNTIIFTLNRTCYQHQKIRSQAHFL